MLLPRGEVWAGQLASRLAWEGQRSLLEDVPAEMGLCVAEKLVSWVTGARC